MFSLKDIVQPTARRDHLAPLIALRGDCEVVAKLNRAVLSQHRDNLEVHFAAQAVRRKSRTRRISASR